LIEDLLAEGKKNMATISPGTIMNRTTLLEQLLIERGVLEENDRFRKWKGKQGGAELVDEPRHDESEAQLDTVRTAERLEKTRALTLAQGQLILPFL
jgi:hypothetical protein